MTPVPRKKFKSIQDWHLYVPTLDIQKVTGQDLFELRKACYLDIERLRGRPLLVYASKFVNSPPPPGAPNSIEIGDVDGFTDMISSIREHDEVDVLIHSPGGRPDATERIVELLRSRFKHVHFLIPHSAYSAATMLALSGDTITLHPSATLGPIDPQLEGIPARSIKKGFEKVKAKIAKEGPETLPAYIPLIEKYTIHLLELCEDSEALSKNLVSAWLKEYMFKGQSGKAQKVRAAVNYFSDYDKHLLHSRPLTLKKLKHFDLNIEVASDELEDLLWEAYVLLDGFFGMTAFVKIYESAHGISWGRQYQQMIISPK